MLKNFAAVGLAFALCGVNTPASAQEKGDMTVGVGVGYVMPEDGYSSAASVRAGDNARPTVTFEYFVANDIGIEFSTASPFKHDIEQAGVGDIGSSKHLPITVSLQYHFTNTPSISSFVGAGINYAIFWDEKLADGRDLSLENSWAFALHGGADFAIGENSAIRTDIRWRPMDFDMTVGTTPIGSVDVDPWTFGVSYVVSFRRFS